MEAVCKKAATLDEFLKSRQLQDEYYEAAQEYFGGKEEFPRDRFNAILNQLISVGNTLPEVKERAWETTGLGPTFTIKNAAENFGKVLDPEEWMKMQKEWIEKVTPTEYLKHHLAAGVPNTAETIAHDIQEFEKTVVEKAKTKKAQQVLRDAFYKELGKSASVQDLAKALVFHYLQSPQVTQVFESQNADSILTLIKDLRNKPTVIFQTLGITDSLPVIASEVRNLVPNIKDLLKEDSKVFLSSKRMTKRGGIAVAERSNISEYTFKALPRRFHGIFKGITVVKECVGGSPDYSLEDLTPERWATVLLKGTHLQNIEQNGKYLGFVQAVPIKHNQGRIAASVDFGSRVFNNGITYVTDGGKRNWVPLSLAWVREANKHKPLDWDGYLVSDSTGIDNSGAKYLVKLSPDFLLSNSTRNSYEYSHVDDLGRSIPHLFPKTGQQAVKHIGRMVLDGMIRDATKLTLLQPTDLSIHDLVEKYLNETNTAQYNNIMQQLFYSTWAPLTRTWDPVQLATSLRDTGLLGLLAKRGMTYIPRLQNTDHDTQMELHVPELRALGFTTQEMNRLRNVLLSGTRNELPFIQADIVHANSANDFLDILLSTNNFNLTSHMGTLLGDHLGRFLIFDPKTEHYNRLFDRMAPTNMPRHAVNTLLPLAFRAQRSFEEYLALAKKLTHQGVSSDMAPAFLTAIDLTIEPFLKEGTAADLQTLYDTIKFLTDRSANREDINRKVGDRLLSLVQGSLGQAWKARLATLKTPQEHIEALKAGLSREATALHGILGPILAERHAAFEKLNPTPQEKLDYHNTWLEAAGRSVSPITLSAVGMALKTSETPRQFIDVFSERTHLGYGAPLSAFAEAVKKTLPNFIAQNPETPWLMHLIDAFEQRGATEEMLIPLITEKLKRAKTPEEYLQSLISTQRSPKQPFLNALDIASQETIDHFVGLKPNNDRVRDFMYSRQSTAKLGLVTKLFEDPNHTAQRYLEIMGMNYMDLPPDFIDHTFKTHFLDKNPTWWEISQSNSLRREGMLRKYIREKLEAHPDVPSFWNDVQGALKVNATGSYAAKLVLSEIQHLPHKFGTASEAVETLAPHLIYSNSNELTPLIKSILLRANSVNEYRDVISRLKAAHQNMAYYCQAAEQDAYSHYTELLRRDPDPSKRLGLVSQAGLTATRDKADYLSRLEAAGALLASMDKNELLTNEHTQFYARRPENWELQRLRSIYHRFSPEDYERVMHEGMLKMQHPNTFLSYLEQVNLDGYPDTKPILAKLIKENMGRLNTFSESANLHNYRALLILAAKMNVDNLHLDVLKAGLQHVRYGQDLLTFVGQLQIPSETVHVMREELKRFVPKFVRLYPSPHERAWFEQILGGNVVFEDCLRAYQHLNEY